MRSSPSHVFVGLSFLAFVRGIAKRGATGPRDFGYVESAGLFWHMVDLIWILLFPIVYLVH
jgi:heme/copper-type cytochrome/quinol oxidase subunit 3